MMGKGMSQVAWQEKQSGRFVREKGHGGERSDGLAGGAEDITWAHSSREGGTRGWEGKGRQGKQEFSDVH